LAPRLLKVWIGLQGRGTAHISQCIMKERPVSRD
jgi:hypothetical protein